MLLTQWMASALFSLVVSSTPLSRPVCDAPLPPPQPAAPFRQTAVQEPSAGRDRDRALPREINQANNWPGYLLDVF